MNVSNFTRKYSFIKKEWKYFADFKFLTRKDLNCTIWFSIKSGYFGGRTFPFRAFFCAAYPLACYLKEDLFFEGEVDKRLLNNLEKISYLLNFGSGTNTSAKKFYRNSVRGKDVGLFFTLGLDSFHSWMSLRSKLHYLIYVEGYDVPLSDKKNLIIKDRIEKIASIDKINLAYVRTNLRESLSEKIIPWVIYHGAALAAAGYVMRSIGEMYISSSDQYLNKKLVWGTGPELDKLWSSSTTEYLPFASGVNRIEKIRDIIKDKDCLNLVLENLRVCWQNTGKYNCLKCEKCLRTYLEFRVLGFNKKFEVFNGIDLDDINYLTLDKSKAFVWDMIRREIASNGREEYKKYIDMVSKYF